MTEIMTWNYAGEADITYGEVHVSPVAKILLAISLIFIAVSAVSAIVFRDNIYDIITNPRIVLLNQVRHSNGNYLEIPYNSDFDPDTLIDSDMYKNDYTIVKIDSNVDSSKLGKYKVKYISKNSVKTNVTALTVYVKDKTAPAITFKANPILLVRGVENSEKNGKPIYGTNSFTTPKEFISNIHDDCDGDDCKPPIVYDCSNGTEINIDYENKNLIDDYGKEGITTKILKYKVTDKAGNMRTETLTITIVDNYDAAEKEIAQLKSSINTNTNISNNNSSSGNRSNTATSGPVTFSADPITWSISQNGPITSLTNNPKGIHVENGQAWPIGGVGYDYQPEGPGVYERTWECDGGSTVTQQVTIIE